MKSKDNAPLTDTNVGQSVVDVEGLKKEVHEACPKGFYATKCEVVDYLVKQGHLTSSEKPTHSIPEGYALVPVELSEGIRRCIENLMFAYGYDGEPIPELEDKFYKSLVKTAKGDGE